MHSCSSRSRHLSDFAKSDGDDMKSGVWLEGYIWLLRRENTREKKATKVTS